MLKFIDSLRQQYVNKNAGGMRTDRLLTVSRSIRRGCIQACIGQGGVSQHALGGGQVWQTPPPRGVTDLWKHNLRKLRLRAVKIEMQRQRSCLKITFWEACHSVHGEGGGCVPEGHAWLGCAWPGGMCDWGWNVWLGDVWLGGMHGSRRMCGWRCAWLGVCVAGDTYGWVCMCGWGCAWLGGMCD